MRTRSRGTVVRGAVATVTLTLLSSLLTTGLFLAAPARAEDPDQARALDLLTRVIDAFMPHTRPEGRKLPRRDVGLMLRDLRQARDDLGPTARLLADQYLARPSAGEDCRPGGILNPESVLRTTHFCIHYKTGGGGAASLQQAQLTGATLENVWTVLVSQRGFRPPIPDGDGVFDVTLKQLGNQGIYGYCTTDRAAAQSSSYCVLDNDFSTAEYGAPPINSLRVTAAHEFFHAIQFAYDSFEQSWVMEGGAVWAEDEVYPTVNDYLQYLAFSPIRVPGTPIDSNGSFERYGMGIFWKFLAEYLRDPSVIRQFWRLADSPAERDGVGAVVATLAARKKAFGPTFARFAAWNTLPPGSYADRRLFPAPRWAGVVQLRLKRLGTGPLRASLDHLSSAAYLIQPARTLRAKSRLRVSVDGPARVTQPQALVQVRLLGGRVDYYTIPLNAAGDGARAVPFDPRRVRSVVVTLSNASVNRADDQPFTIRARVVR